MAGSKYYRNIRGFSMDGLGTALKMANMEMDDPLDFSVYKGSLFLECKCSVVHGFQMEISRYKCMSEASLVLPTNFHSAFVYPLLQCLPINPSVLSTITNMLESRQNSKGFWNYLFFTGLMPDDGDTICTVLMTLLLARKITEGECRAQAELLINTVRKFEDGVVDLYLPESDPTEITATIEKRRRVDIGTLCNIMWLLGRLALDTTDEVVPTLRLMDRALDDLLRCGDFNQILPNCKYYTSQHVLCFLFSRCVTVSCHAEKLFKERLIAAVKSRLNCSRNPLHIGCSILAALNLGMESNPEYLGCILREAKTLLGMQCENGSFPSYYLYEFSHPVELYFGSSAVTTAISVAALKEISRKVDNASYLMNSLNIK